jgi:hypothetical protein
MKGMSQQIYKQSKPPYIFDIVDTTKSLSRLNAERRDTLCLNIFDIGDAEHLNNTPPLQCCKNDFLRIDDFRYDNSHYREMSTEKLAFLIVKIIFPYLNKKDTVALACSSKILNKSVAKAMYCKNCNVSHKFLNYENAQLHWCLLRGGYIKNLCSCGHYKDCCCYIPCTYYTHDYEIEEFDDEDINFDFGIEVNM